MRAAMLIDAARSLLLVIDLQEKMLPAIAEHERSSPTSLWLDPRRAEDRRAGRGDRAVSEGARAAWSPAIRELLPDGADRRTRTTFPRRGAMPRRRCRARDRAQVVLVGTEAHVCVLQTALELLEDGKEVYVVADAVGSRRAARPRPRAGAHARRKACASSPREMVVFEWLGEAGTPLFREINREFLR